MRRGFTLLELLLVIAIISALAGLVLTALNPAKRLEDANEVKALSNANDIQKALNAYPLTNSGLFPTALQTKFNNGETRVDICVSGQTCDGLDLTTDLVNEGFLSAIPVHPTYATSTDSGYDIVYGGTQGVRIVESPVFLLRDEFITAVSSPIGSPRTAEPGPGTWTVVDPNTNISISNGSIINPNNNALQNIGLVAGPYARKAGRTIMGKRSLNNMQISWHTSTTPGSIASTSAFASQMYRNDINDSGSYLASNEILPTPSGNILANIQQSNTFLYLSNSGTVWTLRYVGRPNSSANLYAHLTFAYAQSGNTDWVRVVDLPAPFNTDYGIATQRLAGVRSSGDTFTHEANAIVEWTQTTLPSSGNTEIRFRIQDTNNYWQVLVSSTGAITLNKVVVGTPSQVATAAGVVVNGHRIIIFLTGTRITAFSNGSQRWTYNGNSDFVLNTSGKLEVLGTGGAVSDIVAWPRTLSGEAVEVLNNATL